MKIEKLANLPKEVQLYVMDTLKAYDEVTVSYENGKYQYGVCIKRNYAEDYKVLGTIYKSDIYTEEEQDINFMETFHDYPQGKKYIHDYSFIKKLDKIGWSAKVKIVNNKFELISD